MKKSSPAARLVGRRFENDPEYQEMLAEARVKAQVSHAIYDARTAAGLSQQELAERIGTSQPAVARLEDGDYDRHSIATLQRIADALNLRLVVRFASRSEEETSAAEALPAAETIRQIVHDEIAALAPMLRQEMHTAPAK